MTRHPLRTRPRNRATDAPPAAVADDLHLLTQTTRVSFVVVSKIDLALAGCAQCLSKVAIGLKRTSGAL